VTDPAAAIGAASPVDAPTGGASLAGLPVARAVAAVAARLTAAGVEDAAVDARLLAAAALGVDRTGLLAARDAPLDAAAAARLAALADRRMVREPVSRILGRREFWSLDLAVGPATLDPRPDSETLVAAVLDRLGDPARAWRIVDLGTGTGCLLLALLSALPSATGLGVDRCADAARTARDNARRLGLADRAAVAVGDWTAPARGPVDAIVANPPYIETGAIPGLAPEVARYDPALALDGGPDGLDAYRALVAPSAALLAPGGWLALEIGTDQAEPVAALVAGAGLRAVETIADLAGRPRVVVGQKLLGDGRPGG
jgi:release factor glutamine methyltransferase